MKKKDIKIYPATHKRLADHGKKGESFDTLINKVLDVYEGKDTRGI